MKKLLALILLLTMMVGMLASCNLLGGNSGSGGSGNQGTTDTPNTPDAPDSSDTTDVVIESTTEADGPLVWSGDVDYVIVSEEETDDISALRQYLYGLVGVAPDVNKPSDTKVAHEIVVGNVGRTVSSNAYARLDRAVDLYSLAAAGDSAFMIYAEGGSIAVAYSDTVARYAAMEYIQTYIKAPVLYADGVITTKLFDKVDFIAQKREAAREVQFAAIEEYLGKENTDALRNFYNLYDEDLYIYIANLYDPAIGGFYYSASGRDTNGFLPDLESTGQALGMLDTSGLTDGYREEYIKGGYRAWQNMIPEEMAEQILNFAINLQAEDHYFYHPQWATVSSSRRGRDAGWARTIIEALHATPKYPFVGDLEVEGASYSSGRSLVMPLGNSTSSAVSGAISNLLPPTVVSAAEELSSAEAWIKHLNESNVSTNSYSVFNNLSARTAEIKAAGLWDVTLTWLEENQYENGTWEPTVCYNSINGLMKVSTFWTKSRPLPRAEAAVKSTLQIMELDNIEEVAGITYVYNPWVVLENILPYCGDAEEELRAKIVDNAALYINGTFEKLAAFMKNDGGFSYNQKTSAPFSQGAYVAVEGSEESDVNATSIAISTLVKYMMPVLLHGTEYEIPSVYSKYDTIYFLETIENLDAVIKKPYDGPEPEVETFDEFDSADGGVANGVTLYPANSIVINLNNEDVDSEGYYKYFQSTILSNPKGAAHDLVLYMKSKVYDVNGNGKVDDDGVECVNKNDGSNNAQFNIVNSTVIGNCFIFETDMMFEDYFGTGSNVTAMQLMFSNGANYNPNNSAWFNFTASRDADGNPYLLVAENFAGADGVKNTNLVGAIPANEWIKLRLEMYKVYDGDGKLSVKVKIFINDVYAAESDSSNYDSTKEEYFDYIINCVRFSCFRTSGSSMYINNSYAAKVTKDYVPEAISDADRDTEIKAPARYDFETTVTQGIYSETYSTQKLEEGINRGTHQQSTVGFGDNGSYTYGIGYALASDPTGAANNVLKVTSTNASNAVQGRIDVDTVKEAGKRVHVLEFDYYFVNNSAANQNILQLDLLDTNGIKMGGSSTIIYNRTKAADKGTVSPGAIRISGNGSGQRLDSRTWYRLRLVIDSENRTIHYHFSSDNGENWYIGATPAEISTGSTLGTLRLVFNAYNNTGVQYLDNISYTVTDTVPTAEIVESELSGAVQPTNKVVYDFETGFVTDTTQLKATSNMKPDNDSGATTYVAGTDAYNTMLETLGKNGKANLINGIGTLFYIVNDPTGASGKVLQAVTRNGSGAEAYVDVIGSKLSDDVTVLEVTFDYYTDYNNYIAKNLPTMRLMLWDGLLSPDDVAAERRLSFFAYPSETYSYNFSFNENMEEGKETAKMENSFKIGSHFLNSHTWYTVKVIITGGKQYTYVAPRGGDFELIATASYSAELVELKYMRLYFGSYNNNGRQYYDNISYVMSNSYVDPTKK